MHLGRFIPPSFGSSREFRPHQRETIEEMINAIDNGNSNIILNAPVGAGKSLMAYILAKYYQEQDKCTYIYTKTKYLQDQYLKDFKDIVTVKGRNNFLCKMDPSVCCDIGCKQMLGTCPLKIDLKEELDDEIDYCDYWLQKHNGIYSQLTLLNYAYTFADSMYIQHFPMRFLGICDEGHNIEKELMGVLENRLSVTKIKKDIGVDIPKTADTLSISGWSEQLYDLGSDYRAFARKIKANPLKKDNYNERSESFFQTAELIDDNPNNWVVKEEIFKGYTNIIFKPIMVDKYTNLLFDKAQHNVIMSGSILKPDIFAKELGLDDYYYIEVPSVIPAHRRVIRKRYCGPMSSRAFEQTFPSLVKEIKKIAYLHSDEKGVIHTFTYKIANRLKDKFGDDDRFIFHNNKTTNQAIFKFKTTLKNNAILVSPVVYEGVDFPYNQARWQIICKDPFPNVGDKQVSARDNIDYGWIFRQRCLVLSQMYGRSNRAVDDYSITYLLDSNIENLLGPATLVTDYFLEGLVNMNYTKPFELCPNAYTKLSPDKRRSYEQERYEETCILNAIRDENLNTLEKLRVEYKKIPDSNSYQYVTPIVERLFKNGAIRYIE